MSNACKKVQDFCCNYRGVFVEICLFLELIFLFLELKEPNLFWFFSSKNFKLLVTQWATLAKFWCYFLKFLAYKTHIF